MSIHVTGRCVLGHSRFYGIIALIGVLAIALFLYFEIRSYVGGRLRESAGRLIIGNVCMSGSQNQAQRAENNGATRIAIYVLGGTQNSLRLKFRTAVSLYQKGSAEKLMIASSKGITEYAQDLNRNLTNDEWTVKQLTRQGVKSKDISLIILQHGFFGTLREANTLKTICIERDIKKLLLICSPYHVKRVRSTFSAIFKNCGVEIAIHAADEQVGLRGLFIEYLKQVFYDNILIPLER